MWTEAHRARHEPDLKELVAACAVEEVAAWLERADPPRRSSGAAERASFRCARHACPVRTFRARIHLRAGIGRLLALGLRHQVHVSTDHRSPEEQLFGCRPGPPGRMSDPRFGSAVLFGRA
jgi:hypothetical protein